MSGHSDMIALATLESLQERLRRIGWHLSRSEEVEDVLQQTINQGKDYTIQARLTSLENSLSMLSSRSPAVNGLLKLRVSAALQQHLLLTSKSDSRYPDLFQPSTSEIPTSLTTSEILAIINSCATSFPTTASRLNAIKDLPIPSAESSASLIALHPRLNKVELLQESHARDVSELRTRTASAIQRWYELGILGESECWTEWEGRVVNVEKNVRRQELHHAQEIKENEAYRP